MPSVTRRLALGVVRHAVRAPRGESDVRAADGGLVVGGADAVDLDRAGEPVGGAEVRSVRRSG